VYVTLANAGNGTASLRNLSVTAIPACGGVTGDGGSDAGDGGSSTHGDGGMSSDGGMNIDTQPKHCGCGATPAMLPLLAIAVLRRRRPATPA
jgi:hypothetical protein